jgi:hypothetical protein
MADFHIKFLILILSFYSPMFQLLKFLTCQLTCQLIILNFLFAFCCSFISPIVDVIRYVDTDSPSLGEVYETFDNMLGKIKQIILAKDPTLGSYEQHIRPIVTRRWNTMNTLLHMAAFALNPKWYAPRAGRQLPCDDPKVLDGFTRAIEKIYPAEQASILRAQFLDFANPSGPNLSKP